MRHFENTLAVELGSRELVLPRNYAQQNTLTLQMLCESHEPHDTEKGQTSLILFGCPSSLLMAVIYQALLRVGLIPYHGASTVYAIRFTRHVVMRNCRFVCDCKHDKHIPLCSFSVAAHRRLDSAGPFWTAAQKPGGRGTRYVLPDHGANF